MAEAKGENRHLETVKKGMARRLAEASAFSRMVSEGYRYFSCELNSYPN